jgi:hypothetical protein
MSVTFLVLILKNNLPSSYFWKICICFGFKNICMCFLMFLFSIRGCLWPVQPAEFSTRSQRNGYIHSNNPILELEGFSSHFHIKKWILSNKNMSEIFQITQISCYDANLAPDSCTQYFWGTSGMLNTFNYDNSWQLANQKQTICIR